MTLSTRIGVKLARLRELDRDCRAFGANAHRYRLNAPLSRATVEAFESRRAVTLPDGYRRFLLEIGDGLAGPDYGLQPLEMVALRNPLSLTDLDNGLKGFQELTDDSAEFGQDKPTLILGAQLVLGGSGCGGVNLLVVSGPEQGNIWRHEQAFGELWPTGKDFLRWYECWLDQWLAPGKLDAWIAQTGGSR